MASQLVLCSGNVDVAFLDNRGRSLRSAIEEALRTASRASLAVAYATDGGVSVLEPGLNEMAGRGGSVRLLAGLDDFLTDVAAVERVSKSPGAECRVFLPRGAGGAGRFHPKLYIFDGEQECSVIVGSANLTGAGLETNHEASLWLRSEPNDPVIGAVREGFGLLWNSPRAVAVGERLRVDYGAAKQARDRALADVVKLEEYRELAASLRANASRALIRPGRRWLMITSAENFQICLRLGRWGDERYERIAEVQPGDGIIFYITHSYTLGALAVAVGAARPSQERPWPDRAYPYQMDIQFLSVPTVQPSIRPLIRYLELFAGDEVNWGQRLQTTLREISHRDFETMRSALGAFGANEQVEADE